MSPRLPRITAKEIIAILKKRGFVLTRQSGSHKIFKNKDGVRVTVPFHGAKVLHPKVVKSILRDVEISPEEIA